MSDSSEIVVKPQPPIAWLHDFVRSNADHILHLFADRCMSFDEICTAINSEIEEYQVTPTKLRIAFLSDARLAGAYGAAMVDRAHSLAEQSLGHADALARAGDHAPAAAIKLKLAAKYAPQYYGDKVTVQGPGGKPLLESTAGVPDAVLEAMVQQAMGTRK